MPKPINPVIFREYDVRGVYNQTLFPDDAVRIGVAYAQLLKQKTPKNSYTINVGFDGRLSTPVLLDPLIAGLKSEGINVRLIGLGPTPMLYFSVFDGNEDGGIMITGSHNPKDHNGFKMMIGKTSLFGSEIQQLGKIAAGINLPVNSGSGKAETTDVLNGYVTRLAANYPASEKQLRIAWDAGNGAAGRVLPQLVKLLPGKHIVLNEIVDGNFPNHHPDPSVEENLKQLIDVVTREKLDAGFAFDGDADRIGVVDNMGRVFWGDQILLFLAENIIARNPGQPVIGDVKCSQILFDAVAKLGGKPVMWKTGHSLIKSKMAELSAPLAGEMSGHIFIKDQYYGYDDGIYAAIRFMQHLQNLPQDLAEWRDGLPEIYNTPEMRIECAEERKFKVIDEVRQRLQLAGSRFSDVDGVRVMTEEGWWILRASNTQPALALRAESNSPQGLEKLKSQIEQQLKQSGVPLKFASH
ncbi:MAG: phosphomannomutase/phosphoglucomutase [Alphaproteobacteria bacterium]|nr:MAG: phosphomannomutase/phosphoglucomutase [Alphaproteobacteria bacterium]